MKSVDLNIAAVYACENCGRDNFIRIGRNEQAEAASKEFNCIVVLPEKVTCQHCRSEFIACDGAFGPEVNQGGLDG